MKSKHVITVLIAISVAVAAPAFASGYGPSPFYSPMVGAPASQHGQDAQTVAAERTNGVSQSAYGGVFSASHEAGGRIDRTPGDDLFGHH
jgi:hypothetical protein